tara:strand:+ start:206 stop:457 length:252 start_codon:yes stop_codon:yes gene_type:complete
MYSLLTQELTNLNYNKNKQLMNKQLINKEVDIDSNKNIFNNNQEYSINVNNFNPEKNSPPSEWQFRLIKRINSYNLVENLNDK